MKPLQGIKIGVIGAVIIIGITSLIGCTSDRKKADATESLYAETEEVMEEPEDQNTSLASLPNSLETCKAYSESFNHPFTGETLKKEVVGLNESGLCVYKEEMPNGGTMTCKFSDDTRTVMAKYYKDAALAGTGSFGMPPNSDGTLYTINGKSVSNPLDEVMNNGDCTVSGY